MNYLEMTPKVMLEEFNTKDHVLEARGCRRPFGNGEVCSSAVREVEESNACYVTLLLLGSFQSSHQSPHLLSVCGKME
jgi:hypothetical protein